MPNWCANSLELAASKEVIDEFESKLNISSENFFDLFIPPSPNPDEWYEYNLEKYGCKWNCNANDWERTSNESLLVIFDSPWGPPTALYDTLVASGVDVYAEYYEPGMCFVGRYCDGFDRSYEYSDLDSLDNIPEDLVESWNIRESLSMEDE
jgi:hypothetical protein